MKGINRYKLPGIKDISHRDEKHSRAITDSNVHSHIPEVTAQARSVGR